MTLLLINADEWWVDFDSPYNVVLQKGQRNQGLSAEKVPDYVLKVPDYVLYKSMTYELPF